MKRLHVILFVSCEKSEMIGIAMARTQDENI